MSEWWTYRLSSFLMFSPRTYYRLFELYNAAIWPAQILAIVLGLTILALLVRGGPSSGRIIAAILAASWLWIAIAFHLHRYAKINWPAVYFAAAFGLEAALLIWTGAIRGRWIFEPGSMGPGRAGLWVFLFALAVEPMIGPLLGRGWRQIEVFGVAPDPTAVATLGILALSSGRVAWGLLAIPLTWCVISGATLWTLKAPDAWVVPLAGLIVLALMVRKGWVRERSGNAARTQPERVK